MPFISRKEELEWRAYVEKLQAETLQLTKDKCDLELKLLNAYGEEWKEELIDQLELSSRQKSKLGLMFSIQRARLLGVPEDQIISDIDSFRQMICSSRES